MPLEVKSLKVVQGLEPEYTNQFLIALAECATDGNLDFDEAVKRCLSGDQPGQGPPPFKRVSLFLIVEVLVILISILLGRWWLFRCCRVKGQRRKQRFCKAV